MTPAHHVMNRWYDFLDKEKEDGNEKDDYGL
jgi:hypothetical protein